MGLKAAKGKKYEINKILSRYFLDTAKAINFDQAKMKDILIDLKEQLPEAIFRLKKKLPEDFPKHVSEPIFENSMKILNKI